MKYTVTGTVAEFGIGQRLRLTAAQIDARRFALDNINDKTGEVTVANVVQFKRGEIIDVKDGKDEVLPRSLTLVLTPTSKVPAAEKRATSKAAPAADETDIDALETALEAAEDAYAAALVKHQLPTDVDLTDEQLALVKPQADALAKAKAEFAAAVGED